MEIPKKHKITFILILFVTLTYYPQERSFQVGDHELMLQPTAYTMSAGNSYLTNYELLFMNYSYAVTNRTHIGAIIMFPLVKEFYKSFTIGIKQNYWQSKYFNCAVYGSYMLWEKLILVGNVFSIGKPNNGLNLSIVYSGIIDEAAKDLFFGVGYRFDISENFGLLVEYNSGNGVSVFENPSKSAFIIGGIRFHGTNTSWELGGIRPLNADLDSDFILYPFLKGTYYSD